MVRQNGGSAVTWLDGRSRQDLIDEIFEKLRQYFEDFIDHTSDVPFGYTERPLVGHLALAAHDCNCFTLQDYDVSIKGKLPKSKKKHYRPDLWLKTSAAAERDYVFEVKGDYLPVDANANRLGSLVNRTLDEAQKQLSRHGWNEGKYRCALAALKIHCAPAKWRSYGKNSRSYNITLRELEEVVASIPWNTYETKPNFYFHYFVSYKTVKGLCEKNKRGWEQPPLLGVLCFGSLKRAN